MLSLSPDEQEVVAIVEGQLILKNLYVNTEPIFLDSFDYRDRCDLMFWVDQDHVFFRIVGDDPVILNVRDQSQYPVNCDRDKIILAQSSQGVLAYQTDKLGFILNGRDYLLRRASPVLLETNYVYPEAVAFNEDGTRFYFSDSASVVCYDMQDHLEIGVTYYYSGVTSFLRAKNDHVYVVYQGGSYFSIWYPDRNEIVFPIERALNIDDLVISPEEDLIIVAGSRTLLIEGPTIIESPLITRMGIFLSSGEAAVFLTDQDILIWNRVTRELVPSLL